MMFITRHLRFWHIGGTWLFIIYNSRCSWLFRYISSSSPWLLIIYNSRGSWLFRDISGGSWLFIIYDSRCSRLFRHISGDSWLFIRDISRGSLLFSQICRFPVGKHRNGFWEHFGFSGFFLYNRFFYDSSGSHYGILYDPGSMSDGFLSNNRGSGLSTLIDNCVFFYF